MQLALYSKPEEDICAACTSNAHRWILLLHSAGTAAIPQPVLQRSGRFSLDCRSLPLLSFESAHVWPQHRPCHRRSPTGFCLPVCALWCIDLPTDHPCVCECFLPVVPFLFPPAAWTPIWPLILSTFVFSWIFHAELGNVQKTFSFCEVFSKVRWDTFVRISIDSQI